MCRPPSPGISVQPTEAGVLGASGAAIAFEASGEASGRAREFIRGRNTWRQPICTRRSPVEWGTGNASGESADDYEGVRRASCVRCLVSQPHRNARIAPQLVSNTCFRASRRRGNPLPSPCLRLIAPIPHGGSGLGRAVRVSRAVPSKASTLLGFGTNPPRPLRRMGEMLYPARHTFSSACSMSATMSPASSMPQASRTSVSVMPIARRSSGGTSQKDIVTGSSISVSTPPRLGA